MGVEVEAPSPSKSPHRSADVERCADGALGVVAVRPGSAKERHDGIAEELVHQAVVARDDLLDARVEGIDQLAHSLDADLLGQRREARHIREENRHRPALPLINRL